MPEKTPTSAASGGDEQEEPYGSPEGDAEQGDVFEGELPPDGSDLDDGEYTVKLADIRDQTSKAGNPMWVADFVVAEGPRAGEEVPMFLVRTSNAMWKVREFLYAMGLIEKGAEKFSFSKSDAIGRMALAEVENPDDNPASVQSLEPITYTDEDGNVRRGPKADTPTPGVSGKPAEESGADDDLPF